MCYCNHNPLDNRTASIHNVVWVQFFSLSFKIFMWQEKIPFKVYCFAFLEVMLLYTHPVINCRLHIMRTIFKQFQFLGFVVIMAFVVIACSSDDNRNNDNEL